jgi:hypothetical protein
LQVFDGHHAWFGVNVGDTRVTIDTHALDVLVFVQTLRDEVRAGGATAPADRNGERSQFILRAAFWEIAGSMSMSHEKIPPVRR